MNQQADFNIDQILDGTLDDLADMPEFVPFPAGTHIITIDWENKTAKKDWINGHPALSLKLKAVETVELVDTAQAPLVPGSETNVLYMLDNELGQGSFKKIMTSLSEHFGAKSNRELIEESRGTTCMVITKIRQNKEKTQSYTDIVELKVV